MQKDTQEQATDSQDTEPLPDEESPSPIPSLSPELLPLKKKKVVRFSEKKGNLKKNKTRDTVIRLPRDYPEDSTDSDSDIPLFDSETDDEGKGVSFKFEFPRDTSQAKVVIDLTTQEKEKETPEPETPIKKRKLQCGEEEEVPKKKIKLTRDQQILRDMRISEQRRARRTPSFQRVAHLAHSWMYDIQPGSPYEFDILKFLNENFDNKNI